MPPSPAACPLRPMTSGPLQLPLPARSLSPNATDTAKAGTDRSARETILVVEDDERVRHLTLKRLKLIGYQKTIYGSWVTSTWLMDELVERLVRWNLHPADLVTHRFPLDRVDQAYTLMASGRCGKVAVCFDEEL